MKDLPGSRAVTAKKCTKVKSVIFLIKPTAF